MSHPWLIISGMILYVEKTNNGWNWAENTTILLTELSFFITEKLYFLFILNLQSQKQLLGKQPNKMDQ